MTGTLPFVGCQIAFTTAPGSTLPNWEDVSSDLRSISTSGGRQQELDSFAAGKATVVLDNRDRAYDPTYAAGPHFGDVLPMRRIRINAGYQALVSSDAPSRYWRLGDTSGTSAAEYTGHGFAGTYVNTPTLGVTGRIQGDTAVTFTAASSERVDLGDLSLFDSGDCTYECWAKLTTPAAECTAFSEGSSAVTVQHARIVVTLAGKAEAQAANDAGTVFQVTSTASVDDNAWHHLVLTKSGTTMTLYVDGASAGSTTLSGTFTFNRATIAALGRGSYSDYFDGTLDEIAVYARALSAAEVLEHYNEATTGYASSELFVGYIDGWEQGYVYPNEATATVTATDAFKVLANVEVPSAYEIEVLADSPRAWWRLGETFGTVAADSSGNGNHGTYTDSPRLKQSGAIFGDEDTAVEFQDKTSAATDEAPHAIFPSSGGVSGTEDFSVEFWFYDNPVDDDLWVHQGQRYQSGLLRDLRWRFSAGTALTTDFVTDTLTVTLAFSVHEGTASDAATYVYNYSWPHGGDQPDDPLADQWNHMVGTRSGNTVKLYLNGAEVDSTTGTTRSITSDLVVIAPGLHTSLLVDEVAVYPSALAADRIAAHYDAGVNPWAGDTTGERVDRVLDAIGWPAADRDVDTGDSTLQPAEVKGPALEHLQAVELTENGRLFVSPDGKVTFVERSATYGAASLATFGDSGSELKYHDIVLNYDDSQIRNDIHVTSPVLPEQVAQDTTSQSDYLIHSYTRASLEDDPDLMKDAADYLLGRYKDPALRVVQMVVKPQRDPTNLFPQVLGRRLADRITVKRRPQSVGSAIDQDVQIEGISHDVNARERLWVTTWSLSPADTTEWAVLDSAVADTSVAAY